MTSPRAFVGDRLAEVVLARTIETPSGCLVWTGTRFTNGYARLKSNGRDGVAHRRVYEAVLGPVPAGLHLDHLCRNRACVNPFHLEPVTCRENLIRGETWVRDNVQKTHCVRGHALVSGNLLRSRAGSAHRRCLACHRSHTLAAGRKWRGQPGNLERHAARERARRAAKRQQKQNGEAMAKRVSNGFGIFRQGDIILIPTPDTERGLRSAPKDPRGLVLADGEVSQHWHQLFGRGHKLFQRSASGERLLVVGGSGGELRVVGGGGGGVDRHTPIGLAPGRYLVRVQRSWSSEHASRRVED